MVVTKITERKTKQPDWTGELSISVLDLTQDADDTMDEKAVGRASYSLPINSALEFHRQVGDVEVQSPAINEHETEDKDVQLEPVIEDILLPVTNMMPDRGGVCLHLRFTAQGVEIRGADYKDSPLYQWPLDKISFLGSCYVGDWEEETYTVVAMRILEHSGISSCSTCVCDEETYTYLMEVPNFGSKLQDIFDLSIVFGEIYKHLEEKDVEELQESIKMEELQRHTLSNSAITPELQQAIKEFVVLVYPQNDPDAVTITQKDIRILRPLEFLNDTIIDFYIKYLQQTLCSSKKLESLHFFNSFFFSKLAEAEPRYMQGRAAFERVKKWTRKVEIFEKDYIFIPVNQSFHWSLIIICHPGHMWDVPGVGSSVGDPCILHLDSMEGCHRAVEGHIKNYLLEEWKERNQDEGQEDINYAQDFFLNMPFVYAKVPQQDNNCDCGLFLLHYVELFLKVAPERFLLKKDRQAQFLGRKWFKPFEASAKRPLIQKLIIELSQGRSLETCKDTAEQNESIMNAKFPVGGDCNRLPSMALSDDEPSASDSPYNSYLDFSDSLQQGRGPKVGSSRCSGSEKVDMSEITGEVKRIDSQENDLDLQPDGHRQDGASECANGIGHNHSLCNDLNKADYNVGSDQPNSNNDAILVKDGDLVHLGCEYFSPLGEERWTFKNCPVPKLSQVIPLRVPKLNDTIQEQTQFQCQPSCLVGVSQDSELDGGAWCSLLKETRFQETSDTSQMFLISLSATSANELGKNKAEDNNHERIENNSLDKKREISMSDVREVALPLTRPPELDCSPSGGLSLDLTYVLSDDSKSNDERIYSWLAKEDERIGQRMHTRERRLARGGGKKAKSCGFDVYSQEVEELSSDDSFETWDCSGPAKSLDTSGKSPSADVGRRTRSKTQSSQRRELTPKEQARQDALALLCKEKAMRRR